MPDETEFTITNRTSLGFAVSKTFGAIWHCHLLFGPSQFSSIKLFTVASVIPCDPQQMARYDTEDNWFNQTQVDAQASERITKLYEGLWLSPPL